LILGVDLGTSSLKVVAIDADGSLAAWHEASYATASPQRGWAETHPDAWWNAALEAVRAVPAHVRSQVRAIGLSGQMHSLVLCSDVGVPVRPAILWSDSRSKTALAAYRTLDEAQLNRLANPIVAGMTGPTMAWLAEHEPAALARARWALQPKDWLRLRLTGEAATDPSDASATLLYDIIEDRWAMEVVQHLGLPASLLPPIRPSAAVGGTLLARPAEALGLQRGLPVVTGAADTPAAAYGSGLVSPGSAQLNMGTGAQIVVIGDPQRRAVNPTTHWFRSALPSQRYTMAAMQNAGLALQWVRSVLDMSWEELYGRFDPEALPRDLVFLPYLSGERTPLLDPDARAAWVGLGRHHGRQDMAAAALAGVALAVRDGFEALRSMDLHVERMRFTGGGSSDPVFSQFVCDVLGVPLDLTDAPHASALGAALLAAEGPSGPQADAGPGSKRAPVRRVLTPRSRTKAARELMARYAEVREELYPGADGVASREDA
jgi:xylulokinase